MQWMPLDEYCRFHGLRLRSAQSAAPLCAADGWTRQNGDAWLVRSGAPRHLFLPRASRAGVSASTAAKLWGCTSTRILQGLLIHGRRGDDYLVAGEKIVIPNRPQSEFTPALTQYLLRGPRWRHGQSPRYQRRKKKEDSI